MKKLTPCSNCPFLLHGSFTESGLRRAPDIADTLRDYEGSFSCHKTTRETGNGKPMPCAGAWKVVQNEGRELQLMQIMGRLGMVDLDAIAADPTPVFASLEDWEHAMTNPTGGT